MLRLDRLRLRRGAFELRAHMDVPCGTRNAVMGPSAAGKSTLLDAIAGFLQPASGAILWNGDSLEGVAPADRPAAMVFQENNLFPHLSAERNVMLGLRPNARPSRADHDRVAEALERVGLGGLGARRPAELSGGQQGRVTLARVLVQDRPLLLLDEPFAALGPALKAEMIALVREIAEEADRTILMITHDPQDARDLDGGVIIVADGQAAAPAPVEEVLTRPPKALADYLR